MKESIVAEKREKNGGRFEIRLFLVIPPVSQVSKRLFRGLFTAHNVAEVEENFNDEHINIFRSHCV